MKALNLCVGMAAIAVSVGANSAMARDLQVRLGGTVAERTADIAVCTELAKHRETAPPIPLVDDRYDAITQSVNNQMNSGQLTPGQGAAAGIVALAIVATIDIERARAQARKICMHNLGYADVTLTGDEEKAYRSAHGDQADAWENTFMSGPVTERVNQARSGKVDPLPPYRSAPWTTGGIQIDPSTIEVKPGDQTKNSVILTARASRRQVATLVEGFQSEKKGNGAISAKAGSLFHQVDFRPGADPLLMRDSATWCGPVEVQQRRGQAQMTMCFTSIEDGYEATTTGPETPYVAPAFLGAYISDVPATKIRAVSYDRPIRLEPSASDPAGLLDFQIKVTSVNKNTVHLIATNGRNEQQSLVWSTDVAFVDGIARLPMWDKQLVLRLVGKDAVNATLEDGAGVGWMEWRAVDNAIKDIDPAVVAASSIRNGIPGVRVVAGEAVAPGAPPLASAERAPVRSTQSKGKAKSPTETGRAGQTDAPLIPPYLQ